MSYRIKLWSSFSAVAFATAGSLTLAEAEELSLQTGLEPAFSLLQLAAAGEGGGGGEGGEGGFDPQSALKDPAVFLSALDVIRAHYLAGLAILREDRTAAGEMFAHPISEIYIDLEPSFMQLGLEPFLEEMAAASDLAFSESDLASVEAAGKRVLEIVARNEALAPKSPTASGETRRLAIEAHVLAEMIDRAALQYEQAFSAHGSAESWLDGYGFAKTARARAGLLLPSISRINPAAGETLNEALALLEESYRAPTPPQKPPVEVSQLLAVAYRAKLACSHL